VALTGVAEKKPVEEAWEGQAPLTRLEEEGQCAEQIGSFSASVQELT
jgi:hypothetical protein